MASKSVEFNHKTACESLVINIERHYSVDSKITSFDDKFSTGKVFSVEFILDGDNENIKNIKVNQSTSSLHPKCKNKNVFQVLIYLNDGNKHIIEQLWGNQDKIFIGRTLLTYSEFPDKKNNFHGLIGFSLNCDLGEVKNKVDELIFSILQLSGILPFEEKENTKKAAAAPVVKPAPVKINFSYSSIAKPSTVLSVSEIYVEEGFDELSSAPTAAKGNAKSEDYKSALESNVLKLKSLVEAKSSALKEKEENEKQLQMLLARIDSTDKKLESIDKAIIQIKDNDLNITQKIKEEVKNLSALISSIDEAKAEVKADKKSFDTNEYRERHFKEAFKGFSNDAKAEVKAEAKVEAKVEVKAEAKAEAKVDVKAEAKVEVKAEVKVEAKKKTNKKKVKNLLNTVVEEPLEIPVVEAPVVEAPAVEALVVEAPVVEAPVVEEEVKYVVNPNLNWADEI